MKKLVILPAMAALLLAGCGGNAAKSGSSTTVASGAGTASTSTTMALSRLSSELLSISQMPTGWSVDNSSGRAEGCDHDALANVISTRYVEKDFSGNGGQPELQEEIMPANGVAFIKVKKALDSCKVYKEPLGKKQVKLTQGEISFPKVGQASAAWNVSVSFQGLNVVGDIVWTEKAKQFVEVAYLDVGSINLGRFRHFVTLALSNVH